MNLTCSATVPSFNSLYSQASSALSTKYFVPSIPAMPSIPNPIYSRLKIANLEILDIVQELQMYQSQTSFYTLLNFLTGMLRVELTSVLPTIPGTSLTLVDLMALSPVPIRVAIAASSGSFPYMPTIPLNIRNPEINLDRKVKAAIKGYNVTLSSTVFGLLPSVLSTLHISASLPTLPTMPSMASIQSLTLAGAATLPDIRAQIMGNSLNTLLARGVFAGYSALPSLPDPLMPQVIPGEINYLEGLNILLGHLSNTSLQLLVTWINNTLPSPPTIPLKSFSF